VEQAAALWAAALWATGGGAQGAAGVLV
jgi:hypothetical protein